MGRGGDHVVFSGLSKRFGDLRAVDDISLSIRHGEIFGLLGPNGAGKTTTINMLCGFVEPSGGRVEIDADPHRGGKRRAIGYCPQDIMVWDTLTCKEQLVMMGLLYDMRGGAARKRAEFLLEAMGLAEKRNKLAKTLSGGMRRRLNIVLALMHEPELVVLDEPQAGLDPQARVLVRDFIRGLKKTSTVILTTHDMEEADRLSDRVAIMDSGRILVVDTPDRLRDTAGIGEVHEVRKGTLEDVFIALTGRRLRE